MYSETQERGMAVTMVIIAIVLLILIAGLVWFFFFKGPSQPEVVRDPLLDTFEQKVNPNRGTKMVLDEGEEPPQTEPENIGTSTATSTDEMEEEEGDSEEEEDEDTEEDDDETQVEDETAVAEPLSGLYEPYTAEKLANASDGDVVLFFHAEWCPSCKGTDRDLSAKSDDIPEGLTILKLDYDQETELKKKYGVTSQHTFVQVDAQGNELKQWLGSATLEDIQSEVQ